MRYYICYSLHSLTIQWRCCVYLVVFFFVFFVLYSQWSLYVPLFNSISSSSLSFVERDTKHTLAQWRKLFSRILFCFYCLQIHMCLIIYRFVLIKHKFIVALVIVVAFCLGAAVIVAVFAGCYCKHVACLP